MSWAYFLLKSSLLAFSLSLLLHIYLLLLAQFLLDGRDLLVEETVTI